MPKRPVTPNAVQFPPDAQRHPISQASYDQFRALGAQEARALQLVRAIQRQISEKAKTIVDEAGLPPLELLGADDTDGVYALVYRPLPKKAPPRKRGRRRS